MIKKLFQVLVSVLAGYAGGALALWAEFGEQQVLPGFKTNSSYTSLRETKYIFVQATAAYQANMATQANSSTILGVMQNNPDVGEAMTIAVAGLSKVVAGAAITANDIIMSNASGRAITVTSGKIACGRALEAAGADSDVVTAMLFHPVRWGDAA